MVHPLLPDPRAIADQVAAERLARTWVGKSASAKVLKRERDRLAAEFLPVCEVIAEGLSPLAEAIVGLDGLGGISGKLRQICEQDAARRAETEARLTRVPWVNGSGTGGGA